MVRWPAYWLVSCLLGWLVSCLVGWLVGWFVGWLVGWLADWLACWLCSFAYLVCFALLALLVCQLDFAYVAWFAWLARRASLAFQSWYFRITENSFVNLKLSMMILKFCRRENFTRDFPGKLWSWAWFFWRPLLEVNFEILLETLQLYRIPNPTWFCNWKVRYMVCVI